MRNIVLSLLLAFFTFLFFPHPAHASNNFTTDYKVTYEVTDAGLTHALLKITLTNTTTQYFATSYKVQLGFDDITNIRAYDPAGPIDPVLEKNDNGYIIDLRFNKKAVGKGSQLTFNLAFDTATIAKHYGKVWEITIPGISNPNDFTSFIVDVKTPSSFGTPTYIKPDHGSKSLTFTKEQLNKSGISIVYGDEQLYAFHLTYHLNNPNVFPTDTEIALPPSTNYQEIFLTNVDPKPRNVVQDKDGNWLAQYQLLPSQKLNVVVDGRARVSLQPKEQVLTQEDRKEYLSERQYWQTTSPEIATLAHELKTPEAIYEYVVKTLKYDFSRVTDEKPRLGAVGALQSQKSAVCREFTDLFIAIARAAGIPARQVDGYAHTENLKQRPLSLVRDILHSWPEYYNEEKKTWIMIDPTWSSTTGGMDYFSVLDYDHLAFVIKGSDSTAPIPAGGYKLQSDKDSKDIKVSFADSLPSREDESQMVVSMPKTAIAGLPITGKIIFTNVGFNAIPEQIMYLSSKTLTPQEQVLPLTSIPPFGKKEVSVVYNPTALLANMDVDFTIRTSQQTNNHTLRVAPFYMTIEGIGAVVLATLALTLLLISGKNKRHK